ncbi:LOB domain-containing protein 15 [Capsicum annuum]|uniref:LOB domain-containing protein 15 n=1 Tax=Capsicum annuum TaxID=4072 RepID=UPI001FB0EA49|nr:LOB domain-containing protein 15 [Capsicum annuum]KAF3617841.1 LOB domain-containing protein 15 [Capsicum annuum]
MSRERERLVDEIVGKKLKIENIDASSKLLHIQQIVGKRHHILEPSCTKLNTIIPCAACKLLRRKCAEECPFSLYFSPHEPQKFAVVHKVFGASNVSKLLMEVAENQRADAANSLVYEANVRLRDPVYGCMGAISSLNQQVQSLQAELNAIRAEILRYKYREATNSLVNIASTGVGAAVTLAELPQAPSTPTHPPRPQPPQESVGVVVPCCSSPSLGPPLYPTLSSGDNFSAIHNSNIPYFD